MTTGLRGSRADRWDVLVVGAGIVGLAHAVEAVRRGLRVAVVERDVRAVGASVRNFGHGCFTAQADLALEYAMRARPAWLRLAREAGFWLRDAGTVVVARTDDEYAVLREFAAQRADQVELLSADQVASRTPAGADVVGGAWFPLDIRVDPREAVPAIAAWLAREHGVQFHWGSSVQSIEPGLVRTARADLAADRVVVAVGHDVDHLFPVLTDAIALRRCSLHMLQVTLPEPRVIQPAILSGLSLLRYKGFQFCSSLTAVRDRIERERPDLLAADVNLMFTQRPDGDLVIGDTHAYSSVVDPFRPEDADRLILTEAAQLLGLNTAADLTVKHRWQGVYAWSASTDFLVETPLDAVRVVSVTSGIGMSTAFGLAPTVFDDLLTAAPASRPALAAE